MRGLTITNLTFPPLGDEDLARTAAALGFEGVDFIDRVADGVSHIGIPYRDRPAAQKAARDAAKAYRDVGLPLADFYAVSGSGAAESDPPPLNTPSPAGRRISREWFERALEFACDLGSLGVTVTPGIEWDGEDSQDSLARSAEELAWRIERGGEVDMPVSVEPVVHSVIRRPDAALALLDLVPQLTLTLDHSHFVQSGHSDRECEPLLARARHLHCRGAASGHLQQPLHASTIDFDRIVELLAAQGYDGYLCCEFFGTDGPFKLDYVDIWGETIALQRRLRDALAASA